MLDESINGLIPAIIQDYYTGRVLMLAYVNQESYDFMRKKGETCFWSRSRNELWHKGATSGNVQKIMHMALDCDNDTLLIQVEQTGSACHKGTYSCFGEETGAFNTIERDYAIITHRKQNPKEGSYTNYLLEKGVDKICKKIGEEAAETIIAAKNASKAELTAEIADLTYHLLVLMLTQDLTPKDIIKEMASRE
ncbi:MAG: bifunctional phosphoribosyl-AMP cyclohydrolase/phosphoribosyl-ATP diphosphatase HisIE [Defluviitaleaceae bacterium]|nr:bifunctional phosphoribosyl-AMP cyclohydrolase/phosphoribosyl-ATP diphosphatase HisIE [Defluviitaleaceae bacterium]